MNTKDPRLVEAERNVETLTHQVKMLERAVEPNPQKQTIHTERSRVELYQAKSNLRQARDAVEDILKTLELERYDTRLQTLQSEVASLERLMSEVALKGAEDPSNAELRKRLVEYRGERDAFLLQIETLQLARAAAATRDVTKEAALRKEHMADLVAQHKAAGAAAIKHAADLVDHLAAAGPKFAAANKAIQDVISLNFAMLRLVGGSKATNSHSQSARAMTTPLVHGTVFALASTRIAQEGPSMDPYVSITTPMGPATGVTQMQQQLQHQLERHRETWAHYEPELNEPTFFKGTPVSKDFYDLSGGS